MAKIELTLWSSDVNNVKGITVDYDQIVTMWEYSDSVSKTHYTNVCFPSDSLNIRVRESRETIVDLGETAIWELAQMIKSDQRPFRCYSLSNSNTETRTNLTTGRTEILQNGVVVMEQG
jgi:hypothetical protein